MSTFKWILHFILISVVSLQLAMGETILRRPSSTNHLISVDDLSTMMKDFKERVKGHELPAACDKDTQEKISQIQSFESTDEALIDYETYKSLEEEFLYKDYEQTIQQEIDSLAPQTAGNIKPYSSNSEEQYLTDLNKLKKNACGQYVYSIQNQPNAAEKCKPVIVKGLVDDVAAFALKIEEDEDEEEEAALFKKKLHTEITAQFIAANKIKDYVEAFINDEDFTKELRRDVLANYLDKVILPLRDLTVVIRGYYPKDPNQNDRQLEKLFPTFRDALYKGAPERTKQEITMGLNPSVEQNNLKYINLDGAMATLTFDKDTIIRRDILSLLKVPTTKNYVVASKWLTLHMMASQIFIYKAILGDQTDIQVPNSCQNHFNGNMPSTLKYSFQEGDGESFLNSIVEKHGLVISEENPSYLDYYLNNVDKNPLEYNYNGLAPFEELKSADKALNGKNVAASIAPELNDYTHFDQVLSYKKSAIEQLFIKKQTGRVRHGQTRNTYIYKHKDIIEKIVTRPQPGVQYEIPVSSGDAEPFMLVPERQNLSVYLAERMQRSGATLWRDIVSQQVRQKLAANQVLVPFPKLYGTNVWRNWALKELHSVIEQYSDAGVTSDVYKIVNSACSINGFSNTQSYWGVGAVTTTRINNSLCGGKIGKDLLPHVAHFLGEIVNGHDYVSIKNMQEKKLERDWSTMALIWRLLRDKTDLLTSAKMNEFSFIDMQMRANSSWAMARLGYMIAMEDLISEQTGFKPVFVKNARGYKRYDSNTSCFYGNIKTKMSILSKAAEVLGIHKPINMSHADSLLSKREKKFVWEQIYSQYNEKTSHLITQEIEKKPAFKYLEDISYQSMLTDGDAKRFISEKKLGFLSDNDVEYEWDEFFNSNQGRLSKKLHTLYTMKGDIEGQTNAYEELASIYGIDNDFKTKAVFLAMDSAVKKPLYKKVIKQAAFVRKMKVESELRNFCDLNPTNHEKMQAIFHQTTVNHMKLNQMAGLSNAKMDEITDKINSLSPDEWMDMAYGFGAGILAIAAIGIGVMCTGVTGGLCAPLGMAMVAAGTTGMGLQLALVNRELTRKIQANELEKHVKRMEDLGFAVSGSSDNVSRGWTWTIIELVSIIPLIGAVSKSLGVGTKMTIAATHALLKETGRRGLKKAWAIAGKQGRGTMLESDIVMAQFVAGQRGLIKTISEEIPRQFTKLKEDIKRIGALHSAGRISTRRMLALTTMRVAGIKSLLRYTDDGEYISKSLLTKSIKENDQDIIKTFVKYWGSDLRKYNDHIRGIWGKWSTSKQWRGNRLKYAEAAFKKAEAGGYKRGLNWIQKFRFEHLATVAPKLRNLRRHLKKFVDNGQVVVKNKDGSKTVLKTSEEFVAHFMEDMTDIHIRMGMRAKELPYMFLLQGGPHTGGFFGKRVPNILGGYMGDNFMMRKLFNARARLYYESQKQIMKKTLSLPRMAGTDSVFRVFRAFTSSVEEAADKAAAKEGAEMLKKFGKLKWKIAGRVLKSAKLHKVEKKLAKMIHSLSSEMGSRVKAFQEFPTIFDDVDEVLLKMKPSELANNIELNEKKVFNLLFKPQTDSEKNLAEAIWGTIPTDDLLAMQSIEGLAHNVAKKLSNYNSADQFERYLNALKILVVKRDPGIVEVF